MLISSRFTDKTSWHKLRMSIFSSTVLSEIFVDVISGHAYISINILDDHVCLYDTSPNKAKTRRAITHSSGMCVFFHFRKIPAIGVRHTYVVVARSTLKVGNVLACVRRTKCRIV